MLESAIKKLNYGRLPDNQIKLFRLLYKRIKDKYLKGDDSGWDMLYSDFYEFENISNYITSLTSKGFPVNRQILATLIDNNDIFSNDDEDIDYVLWSRPKDYTVIYEQEQTGIFKYECSVTAYSQGQAEDSYEEAYEHCNEIDNNMIDFADRVILSTRLDGYV